MIQERDLGRMLDEFFADGPTQAPDRVLLVAGDRIEHQRQRPSWLVRPPRVVLRPATRPIAVLIAILVIALLGATVLTVATPSPTPNPSPTPTPTGSAAVGAPVPVIGPESDLAAGRYLVRTNYGPTSFDLPPGWSITTLGMLDFTLAPTDARPDDGIRVFFDMHIASKDASCTEAPEPGIDTTVRAMVVDLVGDDRISVGTPVGVTIGGLSGQRLDVRIAPTTTSTCPFVTDGSPSVPLLVDDAAYVPNAQGPDISNGPFWGVGPRERLRLVLLDRPRETEGNVVFIVDSVDGTTFDDLVARSMPVIESFTFDTGS
jgi:hypothetical protein